MPQLIVIRDSLSGERETFDLVSGATLAANLRRLYPRGLAGPWRVYRDTVHEDHEIAAVNLPGEVVQPFAVYILARGVAADPVSFFINLAISLALSYIAKLLAPRVIPRRESDPDTSGNNALAGQSNRMRVGGRVPDILGTVRSYPDLLCNPIETWWKRTQTIQQFFVVGAGRYDIPLATVKLGETPITDITGASFTMIDPEDPDPAKRVTPQMRMVRESPEVRGISLMSEGAGTVATTGVEFDATAKTMVTDVYLAIPADTPIRIDGTNFNDAFFWVDTVPDPASAAPYTYVLTGPVVDETGAGPSIVIYEPASTQTSAVYYGTSSTWFPTPTGEDARLYGGYIGGLPVGSVVKFVAASATYRGTVVYSAPQLVLIGGLPTFRQDLIVRIEDPDGVTYTFPNAWESTHITHYLPGSETGAEGSGTPETTTPEPTNWFTVPMEDPTEIWIDIAFKQGLAHFASGYRDTLLVSVQAEFRRKGQTEPPIAIAPFVYTEGTSSPLRFTQAVSVAALTTAGLPAGSPWIQVRLTKTTNNHIDDDTNQYLEQTFWERLAAMRYLPATHYDGFTVVLLAMANSRSAVSMGETTFNCVATRVLPTWDGSAWTEAAPTDKWADNFVARCKATDGANKTDAQIDIAGIYELQAQLDDMDGGAQGRISMTLDQMQDIDSELVRIADVVRAVVYRVGKKIYASRDQATATRIALFNGRTKNPDGESVSMRMTNDGENDSVTVNWLDVSAGYKVREYTYSPIAEPVNPLQVSAFCANWPQAWRRARYEMNRIRYRREQIAVSVTEDGRICRPGDVVNITDDIANLAASAGEVLIVDGGELTLDRDVAFSVGHTYSILLRDLEGQTVDTIPVTEVAGVPNKVQLSRDPVPEVTIKGRDSSTGTLYAFFDDAAANVRPWLLTGVSASGPYVQLQGTNYNPLVYQDDTTELEDPPLLLPESFDIIGGEP